MSNKKECEGCKIVFRSNKIKKAEDGRKLCTRCRKNLVTNPFYVPFEKRKQSYISNYSLSNQEKFIIHSKLVRQGNTSQEAWRKINSELSYLKNNRFRKRKQKIEEKTNQEKSKKLNKEFKESFKKIKNE